MRTPPANFDAGQARIRLQNEDARRGEFLRAMDEGGEVLSDFEVSFIGSFMGRMGKQAPEHDFQWFTPGRRAVVDGMIHCYGFRSLKTPPVLDKLPTAAAGHCGYLIRDPDTNRRVCCDAPAMSTTPRGLELCEEHALARAGELAQLRAAKERFRR